MDNHLLVAELKAAAPGAVKAIYDCCAEGLFTYCWFVLRNADAAQMAVRDSFIVAEAHIARLADPGLLKPWLYALARVECLRRRPSPVSDPDSHPARQADHDADAELMAWHAVMDLGPLEREALELSTRHSLGVRGVAAVLGIPTRQAELLLIRARESLEQALAGEILARVGAGDCPDRAAMLADWDGTVTAPMRERLVRHTGRCPACRQHVPRNVSATKVYGLLPVPVPPAQMRMRTLGCFSDPELAGYRALVAGRAAKFGQAGFPVTPAAAVAAAAAVPRRGTSAHLWVGLAAALAATAAGVGLGVSRLGGFDALLRDTRPGSSPVARHATVPRPRPQPGPAGSAAHVRLQAGSPITSAPPFGVAPVRGGAPGLAPPFPPHPLRWRLRGAAPLPQAGDLRVSSPLLDLGPASSGSLVLSAVAGQVAWSASTSSRDLTLSSYQGSLPAGGQVTLVVHLAGNHHRSNRATVLVGPGNLGVLVTWTKASQAAARPSRSRPSSPAPPTPSARPGGVPSPAQRPSPTQRPSPAQSGPPPSASYPGPSAGQATAPPPMPPPGRPWSVRGQDDSWRRDQWPQHRWPQQDGPHRWQRHRWRQQQSQQQPPQDPQQPWRPDGWQQWRPPWR